MDDDHSHANARLLFSNVPFDCHDDYLRQWVEARGYSVLRLRLVRDYVSGTSPSFAYVQLMNPEKIEEAARALNGQTIGERKIEVARMFARAT